MKLLIIRPQPGADATAKKALMKGLEPVVLPLFQVEALDWEAPPPENFDALLITSANAIRHGGEALQGFKHLPTYAVGEATAKAATDAGFEVADIGSGGAVALMPIPQENGHHRLLWPTGAHHIWWEAPAGMMVDKHIVYHSAALPEPPEFARILSDDIIIALHSPRAASIFEQLCDQRGVDRGKIILAAMSPNIAKAAGNGWKQKIIAEAPDDDALISAISACFANAANDP